MRPPAPLSGLTDSARPGCCVARAVPMEKLASKWLLLVDSPAALASGGAKVWSPNEPLVTALEIRSDCVPNP